MKDIKVCGEMNVPSAIQCRINYIEANESRNLMNKLANEMPDGFYMNRDLPELEYVDYVAAEIYRDERAEAKRLNYICLFDYLFISSQMSAKPYFIGSTGILLLW